MLNSIWGIQRPRANKLRDQRWRWLHQRNSSPRSGCRPDRGKRASHSVAADGSTARPRTCQGHHSICFGMGSPACIGNPVQAGPSGTGSLDWLRLLRGLTLRLGRVRQAVASMLPPGIRSRSVNQALRSSEPRVKGCRAGVSPGPSGEATRQVSAQMSSAGCPELLEVRMAGSQVACSRLMAATLRTCVGFRKARVHCRSTATTQ